MTTKNNQETPPINTRIEKALQEQSAVCALVEESLRVNGFAAVDILLNKKPKSKPILR
jgi:hypothetical protein